MRQQLLALLGLVLTGVVAFASTTFVSNAMAGVMLRAVGNLHPGDWVRVGPEFGRVTERGLFHVEIQTEDSDLATLPNMYLVTQPVTVVRDSGTVVSAQVSLGYDVPRDRIEACLLDAARRANLDEPFVRVLDLGDFSIQYRVAGFLRDVKRLLPVRSELRAGVVDALHGAGIEIVSPAYVNQRRLDPGARVVADASSARPSAAPETAADDLIFDKAEQEASKEALRTELAEVEARLEAGGDETPPRPDEIAALERRRDAIRLLLEAEPAGEAG